MQHLNGNLESRAPKSLGPVLVLGLALSGTALLASGPDQVRPLHARGVPSDSPLDSDDDGLADVLELRLGLAPDNADTDGDGFEDPEELARHSSPLDPLSVPTVTGTSLGVAAYYAAGLIHPVTILYAPDGVTKPVHMGARIGTTVRTVPFDYITSAGTVKQLDGLKAGSMVTVWDGVLDPFLVVRFGSLSLFTRVADQGVYVSAGVVNFADKDGVLVEQVVHSYPIAPGPGRAGGVGGVLSTGVYEPLDESTVPLEWTPGEICAQSMAIAGTVGPVIIQEVVEAACEAGWDAFCDPACSFTVGTTVETLDPAALLGG